MSYEDQSFEQKIKKHYVKSSLLGMLPFMIYLLVSIFFQIDFVLATILLFLLASIFISVFIISINHLKLDFEIINELKKFSNETFLGLHSQLFIRKKYQDGIINQIKLFKFLTEKEERRVIRKNLISLKFFEMIQDYKYILIAMGSILEFLLIRYCKVNNISPIDSNGNIIKTKNAKFWNYVQSAISINLFNQKKKWTFIQSHLRDLRNYVHIAKECVEEDLDKNWYKSIKPIFESIFKSFSTDTN